MNSLLSRISKFGDPVKDDIKAIEDGWGESVSLLGDFRQAADTIYDCYPYLFRQIFPSINDQTYLDFAVASRLFAASIISYDKLMDADYPDKNLVTFSPLVMQWEAQKKLSELFVPQSNFWNRLSGYYQDHVQACAKETYFQERTNEWEGTDDDVWINIALKKNGISRAAAVGLSELSGDETFCESLIESINGFNVACQMLDDLVDWKKDLTSFRPSLLLARIYRNSNKTLQALKGEDLIEAVGKKIYYEGYALHVIDLGTKFIDKSLQAMESVNARHIDWCRVVEEIKRKLVSLKEDIAKITHRNIERLEKQTAAEVNFPNPKNDCDEIINASLKYVVKQWKSGFGEARHIMKLTTDEGFSIASDSDYKFGDVFQRALISTALCEIQSKSGINLEAIIESEISYLISRRSTDGVCGWRYFPDVLEIAPDADDLGQVIQAFVLSENNQLVLQYCEKIIKILLNNNARKDGSLETWIVPKQNRSEIESIQHQYNTSKWGLGPDVEVVANFIYSLHLYDKYRFRENIQKAVGYFESSQKENGSWESRWYYGSFYGTYVVVRLLSQIKPNSPTLALSAEYIFSEQREDGGWGTDESDQLNTSLALLALYELNKSFKISEKNVLSGINYLIDSTSSTEGREKWQLVPFIKPRVGDSYASRTITAMYISLAVSCWKEINDQFAVNLT